MNRFTSFTIQLLLTTLFGSILATNLQAQISLPMTVSIPFSFTVDKQEMASGTYKLSLESDPFLLSIVDLKNGRRTFFAVSRDHQSAIASRGKLLFQPSHGSKQLYEMYFPGSRVWIALVQDHPAEGRDGMVNSSNALTSQAHR